MIPRHVAMRRRAILLRCALWPFSRRYRLVDFLRHVERMGLGYVPQIQSVGSEPTRRPETNASPWPILSFFLDGTNAPLKPRHIHLQRLIARRDLDQPLRDRRTGLAVLQHIRKVGRQYRSQCFRRTIGYRIR